MACHPDSSQAVPDKSVIKTSTFKLHDYPESKAGVDTAYKRRRNASSGNNA
jgi:hypothetical protein